MTKKLFTNDRYLRNRPFFVLYVTNGLARKTDQQREAEALDPLIPKATLYAGDPNSLKQISRFEIVDRVSSKHEREATVILDIVNMKIVKDRGANPDEALKYLSGAYSEEIAAAMELFIHKRADQLREQGLTAADFAQDDDQGVDA